MSDLISNEDFDTLPSDPRLRFVQLEQICRRNMEYMLEERHGPVDEKFIRCQYILTVSTAAEELGIEGIDVSGTDMGSYDQVTSLMLDVDAISLRIRLRSSRSNDAASVRLAEGTRGKIEQQIQKLRLLVAAENMPEPKRKALLKHLNDLSTELSQSRVNFGKAMVVLSAVGAIFVGGTTVFAEGPQAIATIVSLLGHDKQAEDAETQRRGAPPVRKALPAPSPRSDRSTALARPMPTLGDDIPF